ncbi:MAG: D-alanyl-D-alanine carboxypeptidase family protein [Ruminococcaceae bacterium]|nr:D-alanyl-D-alanine carboxypeptidase family protein [Oscillospiraceae bacterium]
MEPNAAKAAREMLDAMKAKGLKPQITSTFRTYEKQVQLFENKVSQLSSKYGSSKTEEEIKAIAAMSVAIPNTSEHQMGLAIDIVGPSGTTSGFEKTAEGKWLAENSWKYGFILRYPDNKTVLTKIIYEPWHFRYVGVENAKAIYESGLCLEEYLYQIVTAQ